MLTIRQQIQDAAELIQQARRIVALTGAGISTESGIPDFRSPGSIWQRQLPVSYHDFLNNSQARQRYWQTRRNLTPPTGHWSNWSTGKYCWALSRRISMGCTSTLVIYLSTSSNCMAPHALRPVHCAVRAPPCKSFSSVSTLAKSTQAALSVEASSSPPPSYLASACQRQNSHAQRSLALSVSCFSSLVHRSKLHQPQRFRAWPLNVMYL